MIPSGATVVIRAGEDWPEHLFRLDNVWDNCVSGISLDGPQKHEYPVKVVRFPAYKDLSSFDFTASEINEILVCQLPRCEFIDPAENVVLIGRPGLGKSHTANAFASSQRSSGSIRWIRKKPKARPGKLQRRW